MHENLVFDTSGRISAKPDTFIGVKCDDRLNQANSADRQQILRIFFERLILFHDVCNEAQIPFYQNMFRFKITLRIIFAYNIFLPRQ